MTIYVTTNNNVVSGFYNDNIHGSIPKGALPIRTEEYSLYFKGSQNAVIIDGDFKLSPASDLEYSIEQEAWVSPPSPDIATGGEMIKVLKSLRIDTFNQSIAIRQVIDVLSNKVNIALEQGFYNEIIDYLKASKIDTSKIEEEMNELNWIE